MARPAASLGPLSPRLNGPLPRRVLVPRPWLLLLVYMYCLTPAVATRPDPAPVVSTPPLRAFGRLAQQLSNSRKRAFKRAQVRVLKYGSTTYRGQQHTPASLALKVLGPAPCRPLKDPAMFAHQLRIATWNAGGLGASRYAELLGWLRSESEVGRPIHVMCVQETKWSYDAEYSTPEWHAVHTSLSKSSGGVLILVHKSVAQPSQIRFTALDPGRALHVRVALSRPLDLLGVYQHAWVSQAKLQNVAADSATQKLFQARHRIWDAVRFWARAVPQRNVLVMLGDFNCSLRTCLPHIGSGLAPHKHLQHPDQHEFQSLVQHCDLVALNTVGHAGRPSGTYLHFNSHVVQIDFILTRLPCHQSAKQARPIPHAEVVHPTGLHHVPVATYLSVAPPKPCPPKPQPVNRTLVQKLFQQHPGAEACYQQRVQHLLTAGREPEQALQAAWIECTSRFHVSQSRARQVPEYNLKNFWASKTRLREALREVDLYWSPVAWHCSDSCTTILAAHFPGALSRLSVILQGWKAAIEFAKQNRHLRQRVLQTKRHEVDSLIRDAQATQIHGLSGLYRLSRKLHPKTPRRSIHFRFPDGRLMTEAEELRSLQAYFEDLYDSHSIPHQHWVLHDALQITRQEVELAFQHFSATKALPLSQIPACLWKVCSGPLIPHVQALFNAALQPGPLVFPVHWHKAFLTLLPKPGKQPNQPGNLRPISLLPALPKLLARIAAERLKPYLIATLQRIPHVCLHTAPPGYRCS